MNTLEQKLNHLRSEASGRKIKIMIMGLGSVGMYLLDYLMSGRDENMEIYVVGRNEEKMQSDVNIIRVASLIRGQNRCAIHIIPGVDFDEVASIADCLQTYQPDIVVNSSRVYSGLKYGSISWNNIRAYGIWAPLAIKYIKNIMAAYEQVNCTAIVINTSYSDAVIPWLKSAGKAYPDFGSGNLNHLIPRIRLAVSECCQIPDYWNIDVTFSASHFHDVVISKEGQTEQVEPLLCVRHNGQILDVPPEKIYSMCRIAMPIDGKRNMMNASSNYEIIQGILSVIREHKRVKLHCPGVFGEIGGYPVIIDGTANEIKAYLDETTFDAEAMRNRNRKSIYLDGIENVTNGTLYFTDELLDKVQTVFGVSLVKQVAYDDSEAVAAFLINEVIERYRF